MNKANFKLLKKEPLIAIVGKERSGKTELLDWLTEEHQKSHSRTEQINPYLPKSRIPIIFADFLSEMRQRRKKLEKLTDYDPTLHEPTYFLAIDELDTLAKSIDLTAFNETVLFLLKEPTTQSTWQPNLNSILWITINTLRKTNGAIAITSQTTTTSCLYDKISRLLQASLRVEIGANHEANLYPPNSQVAQRRIKLNNN